MCQAEIYTRPVGLEKEHQLLQEAARIPKQVITWVLKLGKLLT